MKYNPNVPNQIRRGNQWNGDCPFCGKQGHFFMNMNNGLWDCKKCSEEGNWFKFKKLLKELSGVILKDGEELIANRDIRKVNIELGTKETVEESLFKVPQIPLPENCVDLQDDEAMMARKYLRSRHFPLRRLIRYGFQYCTSGRYFNRIIIPVIMFGEPRGFLGRWVPTEGVEPKRKYKNSYDTKFHRLLWNYDGLKNRKPVVVTEGVLSAVRVGGNVTASFGKKISVDQAKLLSGITNEVILLFDSDAKDKILEHADRYLLVFERVKVFLIEDGDPDENELDYETVVTNSEVYNPRKYVFKELV